MNWIQKIKHYNENDEKVASLTKENLKLSGIIASKTATIETLTRSKGEEIRKIEVEKSNLQNALNELRHKYEKVCKENRHLEAKVEKLSKKG